MKVRDEFLNQEMFNFRGNGTQNKSSKGRVPQVHLLCRVITVTNACEDLGDG